MLMEARWPTIMNNNAKARVLRDKCCEKKTLKISFLFSDYAHQNLRAKTNSKKVSGYFVIRNINL